MYQFQIITPQGIGYAGKIRHVLIPAEDGYVGVLSSHAPYVTSSSGGALELEEEKGLKKKFKVGPGFFTVAQNKACFLTESFKTV